MTKVNIREDIIKCYMAELQAYAEAEPDNVAPLSIAADKPEEERKLYLTAARRLGWAVNKTYGRVYNNGRLVW